MSSNLTFSANNTGELMLSRVHPQTVNLVLIGNIVGSTPTSPTTIISTWVYLIGDLASKDNPTRTDWVYPCRDNDHLAHLVEHRAFNLQVLGSIPRVITKVCFHKLIASSTGTGKKHCPSSPSRGEYVGWNPTGSSEKEETWVRVPSMLSAHE